MNRKDVKGYLQSDDSATLYGTIGIETPIKDIDGNKLQVGDLVELCCEGDKRGLRPIVLESNRFFVMGIVWGCDEEGTIRGDWSVKLAKKYYDIENGSKCSGIKYIIEQEQTEFTYQEVVANIKEGEFYECTKADTYKVKGISRKGDNIILQGNIQDGVGIDITQLFILAEPKYKYRIYYVEHTVDGDTYRFKEQYDEDYFTVDECVICNTTKMGRTYGKIKETKSEKLTEKEYEVLDTIEEAE